MRYPSALTAAALLAFATLFLTGSTFAKSSDWQDVQGTTFRGEPIEVLGPFALFKTSLTTGRRMLLRGLSPADCVRFHQEISTRPAHATSWATAKGTATSDVTAPVFTVKNKKLVPVDLASLPEPELLLVLYGSHNDGESWQMFHTLSAAYDRIQRVFPGRVGGLFFGVRHNEIQHKRIATETAMPWLVPDLFSQERMSLLSRFRPSEGTLMLLLSRDGVPLLGTRADTPADTRKFVDDLTELLAQLSPTNPRSWADRSHYLRATRPIEFAHAHADPIMIGNPLRAEGLRQRKVARVDARIDVAADGSASQVSLLPASSVPAAMAAPLTDALRRGTVILPAIDHGTPVAASYDYHFEVPPDDRQASADASWLNGDARIEIPLTSWLVLKPIHVEEKDFSGIDRVDADGQVFLKSMEVTSAKVSRASQMNAFNSDFFATTGPASVLPVEGAQQIVDGETLTWRTTRPTGGLVNFQDGIANLNYCIGYAWTEIEVPADVDAWLGIGSDDGLKIWHNGQSVCDRWVRRMSRLDDDVVPLRLKKGKNQLLIKIQNAVGDWSFVCRLRAR